MAKVSPSGDTPLRGVPSQSPWPCLALGSVYSALVQLPPWFMLVPFVLLWGHEGRWPTFPGFAQLTAINLRWPL